MPSDLGKTLLIANPAAQRGNGAKAAEIACSLLAEWLGQDALEYATTLHPGHATQLAAQAPCSRYDTVITLGGDGVIHETANGLMQLPQDERPRFGVIPVGSGNDYARTLGMSESVPEAVTQFIDAQERLADVGKCNDEYFVETLSFGLDAAIALDTVERRKRTGEQGTILYLKSGLDQLLHHLDAFEFHAVVHETQGDRLLQGLIHMLAIQVGPTYGGGFRICPQADIEDGLFDICYADAPMSVPEATVKFLSAKDAHHLKWKNIHFDQAASLDLSFDRRPPCQVDGEPLVADSYAISTIRAGLRVLSMR